MYIYYKCSIFCLRIFLFLFLLGKSLCKKQLFHKYLIELVWEVAELSIFVIVRHLTAYKFSFIAIWYFLFLTSFWDVFRKLYFSKCLIFFEKLKFIGSDLFNILLFLLALWLCLLFILLLFILYTLYILFDFFWFWFWWILKIIYLCYVF